MRQPEPQQPDNFEFTKKFTQEEARKITRACIRDSQSFAFEARKYGDVIKWTLYVPIGDEDRVKILIKNMNAEVLG